jgi:uncharacterized protein with HEPN domain
MQRDPRKLLWDALDAAQAISEFTSGRPPEEYRRDQMLRSAVERQFQIIGEALGQLARIDPELAPRIPALPRIVAFRNILVHGYSVVDNDTVWRVIQEELPHLRATLDALLRDDLPGRP